MPDCPADWVCVQVCDFGLSLHMAAGETHVSEVFQGTLTHMVRAAYVWSVLLSVLLGVLLGGAHRTLELCAVWPPPACPSLRLEAAVQSSGRQAASLVTCACCIPVPLRSCPPFPPQHRSLRLSSLLPLLHPTRSRRR